MRSVRIVKRIFPDGSKFYIIQRQGWLFRRKWYDIADHPFTGPVLGYETLAAATKNLRFFDGSKATETIVYEKNIKNKA